MWLSVELILRKQLEFIFAPWFVIVLGGRATDIQVEFASREGVFAVLPPNASLLVCVSAGEAYVECGQALLTIKHRIEILMSLRVEFRIVYLITFSVFTKKFIVTKVVLGIWIADFPKQEAPNRIILKKRVEEPFDLIRVPHEFALYSR